MSRLLLIFVGLIVFKSVSGQGTWVQKTSFSGNIRFESVALSIGNKGYMGTGSDGITPLADWWEYDLNTDTWTQKANLTGGARWGAVGFAIQNKGYITTGKGISGGFLADLWEYDPATNSWAQKKNFPGAARQHAASFVINDQGYITTGIKATTFPVIETLYKDTWVYNPTTDTWTQKQDLPGDARQQAVAFSMNNRALIVSGKNKTNELLKDSWRYDASQDQWTQTNSLDFLNELPQVGFATQTNGYIHTGEIGGFWQYQFSNDSWLQKPDIGPESTNSLAATVIQDRVFIYNGTSSNTLTNTWWEFIVNNLTEPSNLRAVVFSGTSIKLTWLDNSTEETGYVVERTKDERTSYQAIQTLSANTNEYIDQGLDRGQMYFYRVRAQKGDQFSQYSNRIGAATPSITSLSQYLKSQILVKTINPNGMYAISAKNSLNGSHTVVYNSNGVMLKKPKLLQTQTLIDLSKYPSGVYYLVIIQNYKRATIPLFRP